jgi:myo-inositol-1(or 4)-monophosphatase
MDIAVKAAKEAGKIHKRYFRSEVRKETKSSSFDLVTSADIESEERIVSVIKEGFPEHNFLAEEGKYEKTPSEYTWIIDPLDGTNNFAYGFPIFCSSIALARGNEVVAGVVYDVMHDELFSAEKGNGARLNGEKINVSPIDDLARSMLITGFYYNRGEEMIENL